MAKASFAKLNLKTETAPVIVTWNNGTEKVDIEVKTYLPFAEKLQMVSNIINDSYDENDFYNPMRLEMFTVLEIIYEYTNLNITPKMKEDLFKLYDMIISSGLYKTIETAIPAEELNSVRGNVYETIQSIYKYKNSALGILENIRANYEELNLDASEIQQKLADPDNMELLKSVLTKLG